MIGMDKDSINSGLIQRMESVMADKGLNQRSFANSIGFSYSTLNKYCNRKSNTIDFELVFRILSQYGDIDAEWLITGKVSDNRENLEKLSSLVDTIGTLTSVVKSKEARIKELEEEITKLKKK